MKGKSWTTETFPETTGSVKTTVISGKRVYSLLQTAKTSGEITAMLVVMISKIGVFRMGAVVPQEGNIIVPRFSKVHQF